MNRKLQYLIAGYIAVVAAVIAYEMHIRINDPGNSEFAGMLSILLTMPSSLVIGLLGGKITGIRVGDSHVTFVSILGLSGLINAALIYLLARDKT